MKKIISSIIALSAIVLSLSAQATLISFNASGDSNFSTAGVNFLNGATYGPSGYENVAVTTSSDYVAFNGGAVSPSSFTWTNAGTFDLNGFTIAGAWGSQTLTIDGFNGTSLVNTANLAITTTAIDFVANWGGLTSFVISIGNDFVDDPQYSGGGQHWAMNDVVINESVQSVPEPVSIALFVLSLAGLGFSKKKKNT